MESWGPIFRVSIDLNIKSRVDHLVNIISFKANNGTSEKGNHGDRIPSINFDGQQLEFVSSVNGNPQYVTRSDKKIELDTWYNIVVKQELRNDKIYYNIAIDGEEVHSVQNTDPRRFEDVTVMAADEFASSANAEYKHFYFLNVRKRYRLPDSRTTSGSEKSPNVKFSFLIFFLFITLYVII